MSSRQTPDGAIAGYWYLPATPQHRVGGRLYVQTDGTTVLEVAEKLDASQGPRVQSRFERVIHGRGTDGTLYSLFNNNLRNEGHSRPPDDRSKAVPNMAEYSYYVWHVSTYAVGKDLVDADSSLAAIQLSFSVLREWMSEEAVLESVWGDAKEDRLTIPGDRRYECAVDGATIVLHDSFKASGTRYKSSIEYAPFFEIVDPREPTRRDCSRLGAATSAAGDVLVVLGCPGHEDPNTPSRERDVHRTALTDNPDTSHNSDYGGRVLLHSSKTTRRDGCSLRDRHRELVPA